MNERSSYQSFKCQRFTSSHCKDILGFEHICLFKESILYQKKLTSFDKVYFYSVYPPPPPCIHCIPQTPIRLLWLVVYDMVVMYIIHISKYILITTNLTNKLTEKKKKIVLQRVHGAHIDSNCSYVKLHLGLQSNLTTSLILF